MSHVEPQSGSDRFDFPGNGALFQGVLSRRCMAFLIDFFLLSVLTVLATLFIGVLGIATLGLAWLLLPAVFPVIAIVYIATTVGGSKAASPGMQALGLQARMADGSKPPVVIAVFHALAFYFSVGLLTPFILLVALISTRGRLLHDMVSGVFIVNKEALGGN